MVSRALPIEMRAETVHTRRATARYRRKEKRSLAKVGPLPLKVEAKKKLNPWQPSPARVSTMDARMRVRVLKTWFMGRKEENLTREKGVCGMQPARRMRIAEVPECLRPKGKKRKKGLKQKKRREKK